MLVVVVETRGNEHAARRGLAESIGGELSGLPGCPTFDALESARSIEFVEFDQLT